MSSLYGAIEAGGTKFLCAAGQGPTELLENRAVIPTTTPAATMAEVVRFFESVRRANGPLSAIGIAAFGPIDLDPRSQTWGSLLATPKAGWTGSSLVAPLGHFACPIAVDTDVSAAALAEARCGSATGISSLVYVTVGTGIGGGAIVDGRIVRGMLHPEMGHLRVRRDPLDVGFAGICPFHGDCLEGLASGPAIMARWHEPVENWADDHAGFEIIGGYLGQLAATVALVLSCERVVFGGGVMSDGRLLPFIRRAAQQQLRGYLPIEARVGGFDRYISASGLGSAVGIAGAMLLAIGAAASPSVGPRK